MRFSPFSGSDPLCSVTKASSPWLFNSGSIHSSTKPVAHRQFVRFPAHSLILACSVLVPDFHHPSGLVCHLPVRYVMVSAIFPTGWNKVNGPTLRKLSLTADKKSLEVLSDARYPVTCRKRVSPSSSSSLSSFDSPSSSPVLSSSPSSFNSPSSSAGSSSSPSPFNLSSSSPSGYFSPSNVMDSSDVSGRNLASHRLSRKMGPHPIAYLPSTSCRLVRDSGGPGLG